MSSEIFTRMKNRIEPRDFSK